MPSIGPSPSLAVAEFTKTHLDVALAISEKAGGTCECGRPKLLEAVRQAAATVPAYKALLAEQTPAVAEGPGGTSQAVGAGAESTDGASGASNNSGSSQEAAAQTTNYLAGIPFTAKESYVRRFPLPQRCQGGSLAAADFLHCSSGSTGAPTYWARNAFDELAVAYRFEQAFRDNFRAQERSTLAVIAFPLGQWVGGIFTTVCTSLLTLKGYRVTLVTPGNKPEEVISAVASLGPLFDQTVLLGYPPFIKGVVDAGIAQGVDWARFAMKLVLAGEVFSEEWRDLMVRRCGMKDILRDVVSLWGTADAGVIGCETALSVTVRRWLAARPEVARELFGRDRLPTLVQYDPCSRYLETHPEDGTLVVSAVGTPNTAAPLLRYCIGDAGGLLGYTDMLAFLEGRGFSLPQGLAPRRLPFAWVFGRSFWTVSVYGANVYVENVMAGLEQPAVHDLVTGKFVLHVAEDADLNKQLGVRVELAAGVEPSEAVRAAVGSAVLEALLRLNSEYRSYVPAEQQPPLVSLRAAGDPQWFPPGVKHKYTLG